MASGWKNPPLHWDIVKNVNILWKAAVGTKGHGSPIVADGVVYIGTNNESHRDLKQQNDAGVLMAFDAQTGEFLWPRLSQIADRPRQRLAADRTLLACVCRGWQALVLHQPMRGGLS